LFLSQVEADAIEARVAHVEARTGAQVVTAIVDRSDAYPELVWKAFALGIAVAALLVVGLGLVPLVQQLADPESDIRAAADCQAAALAEVVLHVDHDQSAGHRTAPLS